MQHRSTTGPDRAVDVLVVLFTLAAPVLGGATELWAQTFLALGAVLILIAPPREPLPVWLTVSGLGLLVLAGLAFLPATLFGPLPLRAELTHAGEMFLPGTLSPQPWVTAESLALLFVGLVWTAFLLGRRWTLRRSTLLTLYGVGVLGLAALALLAWSLGWKPPFWQPHGGAFGFFPNRNQTGNVLATASVVVLALCFHDRRRGGRAWRFWMAGYALLGVALAFTCSRAGILLFFLGSLSWLFWIGIQSQDLRRLSLGLSGVLILATLFLSSGGPALERLIKPGEPVPSLVEDLKQRFDPGAFELLGEASWHGIGLGNFEGVFAPYGQNLGLHKRAVHPESDWLWVGIEMGWLAPALILAAALAWLIRNRPGPTRQNFHLRAGLVVACLLFLVHGFADVSGHRPGSLWPALLLFALVRKPMSPRRGEGWGVAWAYRGAAALVLVLASLGSASVLGWPALPSSARDAVLRQEMARAMATRDFDQARARADALLERSPLAWDVHFVRALAGVYGGAPVIEPLRDFARARLLEPHDPQLPMAEADAWLRREPSLAFGAWAEALRRAGPQRGSTYDRILRLGNDLPGVAEELYSLAIDDPELLIVFLNRSTQRECREELDRWRIRDPGLCNLSATQRQQVLLLWAQKGDTDQLEAQLAAYPDWAEDGWLVQAALLAGRGDHQAACETLAAQLEPPTLPSPATPRRSIDALRNDYYRLPDDLVAGYAYYDALVEGGRTDDAAILLARLTVRSGCPAYVHYLQGRLEAERGQWNRAWQAYNRYLRFQNQP